MTKDDPFVRFGREYERAAVSEAFEVGRCALATTGDDGRPSVRFVLLRGFDSSGFVFFTNYESAKAKQLDQNPYAEMAFHWHTTGVQVRVRGAVSKVPSERSDAYFASRDRGSQVGAWASRQSAILGGREELDRAVSETVRRFENVSVTRPPFWGGYRIVPDAIELWYNRDDRLHDRWLYERAGAGWRVSQLYP